MLIMDLSELHPLLAQCIIEEEGRRWATKWSAKIMAGDPYITGIGASPWEALGNMLMNPNLWWWLDASS